jgi:hypothetical protein
MPGLSSFAPIGRTIGLTASELNGPISVPTGLVP